MNISNELFEQLIGQQNVIINSKEKKIVVSAGPGSGKTYTIVKRISVELKSVHDYQGVIACSFTKEASKQLEEKLDILTDKKSSFIGTIDAFILTEIFDLFKNRFINFLGKTNCIEKLDISLPLTDSESNKLTKTGITDWNKSALSRYSDTWISNFIEGKYEISFPAYKYASFIIMKMDIVREYIKNKYTTIYIDEAQDMNDFQHLFLRTIISNCDLNCVLIGDKNQSIYEFRGARPNLFIDLKNQGYTEFAINISVRCHKSILDYSNIIADDKYKIERNSEINVVIDYSPTIDNLENKIDSIMILCDTNQMAKDFYVSLQDSDLNFIYTRSLIGELTNKEFSDNYLELIEEIIKFYLNYNNDNPLLVDSIEKYKIFLSNFALIRSIQDSQLLPVGSLIEYIEKISNIIGLSIPQSITSELQELLTNQIYLNHYRNFKNANRIMTIHSSKGLEAGNVFVVLRTFYRLDASYRRKLFVAFSRAKNFLAISYDVNSNITGSELDRILRANIKRL